MTNDVNGPRVVFEFGFRFGFDSS